MCKGLPGSGKTTWAKEQVDKHPGAYKRVSKDDLRAMLDNGTWSKDNERFIRTVRDRIVYEALQSGKSIIVDDTNFEEIHEEALSKIASAYDIKLEIKMFDTPLEECISRDAAREKPVGEQVIRDMHARHFKPETPEAPLYNPALPDCIIVDIDGTLAKMNGRSPYDYSKVSEDLPNTPIIGLVHTLAFSEIDNVIVFSGRPDSCRIETEKWLSEYDVVWHELYMRTTGDTRKDTIIKKELYETHIKDKFNVLWVIDDRNQVVEMWRSLGLTCLQVADGNF